MPREIVHWDVLERATTLVKDSALASYACLSEQRAAAFIGALAHDVPYYYRAGTDETFSAIAELLHGSNGDDTFIPLKNLAAVIAGEQNPHKRSVLWSFLLGMVSHYVVDFNFHPIVYYFTGNYYDPDPVKRKLARTRHRMFEVYLDSWFRRKKSFWNDYSISRTLSALGSDLTLIVNFLDEELSPDKCTVPHGVNTVRQPIWKTAFSHLAIFQKLFFSPAAGAVGRCVKFICAGAFDSLDALFSFGRLEASPFFSAPITYRNPVSGDERTITVSNVTDEAVEATVKLFCAFEPLVSGATSDVESILGGISGPSLNVAVYKVTSKDMKYFSRNGPALPGLSI